MQLSQHIELVTVRRKREATRLAPLWGRRLASVQYGALARQFTG